ncbi:MAG: TraX family protein [Lachnospiraceae bacterium]
MKQGLTSYQIKVIALILMTIDHIAVYLRNVPYIEQAHVILRIIGRISAPLFLYLIAVGMEHTRSKWKYVLRLYFCAVIMGITNLLFKIILHVRISGNIFPTLFYTALFIFLIQKMIDTVNAKKYTAASFCLLGFLFPYVSSQLYRFMHTGISKEFPNLMPRQIFVMQDMANAFFPNPMTIEYSILFVFIGVLFYFLKHRRTQCIMFLAMCMMCFAGITWLESYGNLGDFFMAHQYWMVLATPFIWLYNGKKGDGTKEFFYIYYPSHQWILAFIQKMIG